MYEQLTWYHCCSATKAFGFGVNKNGLISQIDFPEARNVLLWRKLSDPLAVEWLKNNTLNVTEVKVNANSIEGTVCKEKA